MWFTAILSPPGCLGWAPAHSEHLLSPCGTTMSTELQSLYLPRTMTQRPTHHGGHLLFYTLAETLGQACEKYLYYSTKLNRLSVCMPGLATRSMCSPGWFLKQP